MGSEVTLWGSKVNPMGSMASKITLWDPMGSNAVLWGQSPSYRVRGPSMGSEVTHEVKGHPMGGVKGHSMGSIGSKAVLWDPMGSKTIL